MKVEKAKKLVNNNIITNISMLVERLTVLGEISVEPFLDYDCMREILTQEGEDTEDLLSDSEVAELYESSFGELEYKEPMEYWGVSNWLANQLKERGEVVIDYEHVNFYIWGRCCSGQAINLDGVIQDIAE